MILFLRPFLRDNLYEIKKMRINYRTYLKTLINTTIDYYVETKPKYILDYENPHLILYWTIYQAQDTLFEEFSTKSDMKNYFDFVKYEFEINNPGYELLISYAMGPVEYKETLISYVKLSWNLVPTQ